MAELSDKEYLKREAARRELARKSYRRYLYYAHGDSWKRTHMSDYLADSVQQFVEANTGNAYDILLIETPPQHGKSLTITESLPSWYLGRNPKHRVIEASYNDDTARRFGRKNLEKVEQFGQSLFGIEKGSIWTTTEFEFSNGWGRMISRGIMSGITGNPANLMIIDDPIKNREEADSETYRAKLWGEWQNTLKSRLAAGAKVIVIMTPWHEDDLAARLLKNEPNVRLIRLPVEAEEDDPLGRAPGQALCPELGKDDVWLEQFRQSYINDPKEGGLRAWQALYMCSPRVEGGNLVRREWWKYYDPSDIPAYGTTVISVDAAFKDADDNDFVAMQVWSKLGANYYCRYGMNKHLDFPSTVQAIRLLKKLFPETLYVVIEDKANGSAVIQTLRSEFPGVVGVNPKGGKAARVNAVSPAIESGNVYMPRNELWAEQIIDQFTAFPAAKHDDMVDACFVAGTKIATATGDRPIEEIRVGDRVWTPFGLRKVVWSGQTGTREVITRCGLTGTKNHPVYNISGGYNVLETLNDSIHCDILSLKGVIRWTYRKLLFSMASNTGLWEADDIISVSRLPNEGRRHAKGLHVAVWEYYSGQTVPEGYEVHHKDGNPFNNDFDNLECLPMRGHRALSAKSTEKMRKHLDEVRPLASEWHRSEEGRKWHSEHAKQQERPEREYICEQCGKSFKSRSSAPVRFCSHNCDVKWRYRHDRVPFTKICEWCGKEFSGEVYRLDEPPRTCSRSCRAKLRAKESGNRVNYGEVLHKVCPVCGKEFDTVRRYAVPEGSECCCQSHAVQWGKRKQKE